MVRKKRIGILTGGGDVPGLNSVIKTVVYRCTEALQHETDLPLGGRLAFKPEIGNQLYLPVVGLLAAVCYGAVVWQASMWGWV